MPTTRDLVFDRVMVDFLVRGGARISWRLFRQFREPGPYVFTVEAGSTGNPRAADWAPIGPPQANVGEMIDPARRGYGRYSRTTHYRVRLATPLGERVSRPEPVHGILPKHDWLIARETLRAHMLLMRKAVGIDGWLFKRKWAGAAAESRDPHSAALDPVDGSVVRSTAKETVGTQFQGGFFAPIPFWVQSTPAVHHEARDDRRGTVDDAALRNHGRCVVTPSVESEDVFVAADSDDRYYLHAVRTVAEWRGVPLIADVEMRLAPAGDVAYDLELPGPPGRRRGPLAEMATGIWPFIRRPKP